MKYEDVKKKKKKQKEREEMGDEDTLCKMSTILPFDTKFVIIS